MYFFFVFGYNYIISNKHLENISNKYVELSIIAISEISFKTKSKYKNIGFKTYTNKYFIYKLLLEVKPRYISVSRLVNQLGAIERQLLSIISRSSKSKGKHSVKLVCRFSATR